MTTPPIRSAICRAKVDLPEPPWPAIWISSRDSAIRSADGGRESEGSPSSKPTYCPDGRYATRRAAQNAAEQSAANAVCTPATPLKREVPVLSSAAAISIDTRHIRLARLCVWDATSEILKGRPLMAPKPDPKRDEPVKIDLDPEVAFRALMKVEPDSEPVAEESDDE
jgi:hypothetical protein